MRSPHHHVILSLLIYAVIPNPKYPGIVIALIACFSWLIRSDLKQRAPVQSDHCPLVLFCALQNKVRVDVFYLLMSR
jgi:hypothetical protein